MRHGGAWCACPATLVDRPRAFAGIVPMYPSVQLLLDSCLPAHLPALLPACLPACLLPALPQNLAGTAAHLLGEQRAARPCGGRPSHCSGPPPGVFPGGTWPRPPRRRAPTAPERAHSTAIRRGSKCLGTCVAASNPRAILPTSAFMPPLPHQACLRAAPSLRGYPPGMHTLQTPWRFQLPPATPSLTALLHASHPPSRRDGAGQEGKEEV